MEDQHFEQVINLKDKPSVRKNRTPEMDEMYKQRTFNHLFSVDEDAPEGRKSCNRKTLIWISAATILILASMVVLLLMVVRPSNENDASSGESNGNSNYLDSTAKPKKTKSPKAPDPDSVSQKPSLETSTAPLHFSKTNPTMTASSEFLKTSRNIEPTEGTLPKSPDPVLVTTERPLETSTAPLYFSKTNPTMTTSSEFLKTRKIAPTKGTTPKSPDPVLLTTKRQLATSTRSTAPPHSTEADSTTGFEWPITSTVTVDDMTSPSNQSLEFTSHGFTNVCPVEQSTDTSGCLTSPLELCRAPGACQTFFPNRFGKGSTPSLLTRQYSFFSRELANFTCHPQARDFTCSILSPSCPDNPTQRISESNYAFDVVNFPITATSVPCSSLCTEIGAICLSSTLGGWTELCQSMPESSSSEICFGGNKTAVSQCDVSPCYNGGTCFTKGSESYCKCPRGYFGKVCNKTSLPGTNITRGECASVPWQCLSVLPYNTTRGLNLNDTSLAYIAQWESISTVVHDDIIKRLFCALFYPQCKDNIDQVYTVCGDLCQRTKNKVEFLLAALGFPSLQCEKVPSDAEAGRNGLTCI